MLTDAEERFRGEVRAYFQGLMTPERRRAVPFGGESSGPVAREILRELGRDGWIGFGWPRQFGGRGRSAMEQHLFFDEALRAGVPIPILTIMSIAPSIMQFGTQEQQQRYLPEIRAGAQFAVGYTEPGAGSDLASLTTRARRDGDEYVVNGQKVFTSVAGDSDYIWLAVRTDIAAVRHRGLSILIVPTDSEGFRADRIETMGPVSTYVTYYDDVRVPLSNRVGAENDGWRVITSQLNHERVGLAAPGLPERALVDVLAWSKSARTADGTRIVDQEWVHVHLARLHARITFLRLAHWAAADDAEAGDLGPADASMIKVFGTELMMETYRLLMEVAGVAGTLKTGSPHAPVIGALDRELRALQHLTYGGGTNEIQRDIIARVGLGLPTDRRSGAER